MSKKSLLLFALVLLLTGGCLRVHVNPALQGVQAPVADWASAPDRWQIQYVAAVVEANNSTGVRCPGTITVGAIRYELLTRINAGRVQGYDMVYQEIQQILSDAGCTGIVTKSRPAITSSGSVVVPPQPLPTINADGKRIPAGMCENLALRSTSSEAMKEYGCR